MNAVLLVCFFRVCERKKKKDEAKQERVKEQKKKNSLFQLFLPLFLFEKKQENRTVAGREKLSVTLTLRGASSEVGSSSEPFFAGRPSAGTAGLDQLSLDVLTSTTGSVTLRT